MPQFTFPLPERLPDVLKLINLARTDLRLTLVQPNGAVQGYFTTEYNLTRIRDSATPLATSIAETLLLAPQTSAQKAAESAEDDEAAAAPAAGPFVIVNGSIDEAQVVAVLDSAEQARAFLHGCFLGVFGGERLEKIHDSVEEPWEGMA